MKCIDFRTSIETGFCKGTKPPIFCDACGKPFQKGERYLRIIQSVKDKRSIIHVHTLEWGSTCSPMKLQNNKQTNKE